MNRWLINLVVVILAALSGTTAYFAAKSYTLERLVHERNSQPAKSTPDTPETTTTSSTVSSTTSATPTETAATTTPSSTPTATASVPSSSVTLVASDRLAQPAQTYTVVSGDTLFPIGQKNNLPWDKIAEVNHLSEPYKLKIGQILMLPTVVGSQKTVELDFSADPSRITATQAKVDQGSDQWRLDPGQTAQNEISGFGIQSSDTFRVSTKDDKLGSADVTVDHVENGQTQSYSIHLIQPATKGAKGIWTIQKVTPHSS